MKTLHESGSLIARLVSAPIGMKSRAALGQVPAFEKRLAGGKTASPRRATAGGNVWMQLCSALTSVLSVSTANRAMAWMWI